MEITPIISMNFHKLILSASPTKIFIDKIPVTKAVNNPNNNSGLKLKFMNSMPMFAARTAGMLIKKEYLRAVLALKPLSRK